MRNSHTLLLMLCAALVPFQDLHAQDVPTYIAVPTTEKISIDGQLLEAAWQKAPAYGGFRQRDPAEGEPATEKTQIRILYDQHAIYVGAELFDKEPSKIVSRLSRRDDFHDGDYFQLFLDPYHDHLTGALFQVNAAGSLRDFIISNDVQTDVSWDAVWEAATSISETGWFVEIRIPFSQLRFARADKQVWGINASRFLYRNNESSWLELVPKKDFGQASRFAHLEGIENIEPSHNIEVLPYVRGSSEFSHGTSGNPFNDGSRLLGGSGVDVKYGLSSNLTLDATVNPDFGQVEVDPAVVNLSAFETFFQERRPFFVEGSQIFSNFGRLGGGGGGVVFPQYFYSRRIGRSPIGKADGDFVDRPSAATILGAAKLTGKPATGWTLGLLNATTSPEHAKVMNGTEESRVQIEPAANYTVARVLREIPGRAGLGMLVTDVERRLVLPALQDIMPARARVIGSDGYYYLDKQRVWSVTGRISTSSISGSPVAIEKLQRAPQRYYQRPDAVHVRLDPTRTSLKGWAGGTNIGKNAGGLQMGASIAGNGPGFDTNDAGFQVQSDLWGTTANMFWRQLKPDRFTRNRGIGFFRQDSWNFNREKKGDFLDINGNFTLQNYWNFFGDVGINRSTLDDRLTRGGPMALSPAGRNINMGFNSDGRKKINLNFFSGYFFDDHSSWSSNTSLNIGLKPAPSINLSFGPNFNRSRSFAQYVKTVDDETAKTTFNKRYVFSDLDQSSAGLTTRVNWSLTPRVSVQVFSQLLLSAGDYWDFKELEKPRSLSFLKYGENAGTISLTGDDYTVDPDGAGPANAFTFSNPDFNFKSLRMNAVFRWEWKPGSTLFVVWTQSRSDTENPGVISAGRDLRSLFGSPAGNVFLVKTTYWFNR